MAADRAMDMRQLQLLAADMQGSLLAVVDTHPPQAVARQEAVAWRCRLRSSSRNESDLSSTTACDRQLADSRKGLQRRTAEQPSSEDMVAWIPSYVWSGLARNL